MKKDIGALDKRLSVETKIEAENLTFYDVRKAPFQIYGLVDPTEKPFRRLPKELSDAVNIQVSSLSTNTSGARVRFKTDSEYVAIKAIMPTITHFSHMPFTGSTGFDLYIYKDGKQIYNNSFIPPMQMQDEFESIRHFGNREMKDIVINFPLYNDLTDLYIGLEDDAQILSGSSYTYEKPVLYYGSSITQGGCASRPGNCYPAMISRMFDTDFLNFGYSSGGCGEENILHYLAELDTSVFVLDYDHNAYSVEHLRQTHPRAYRIIRECKPQLPIIMISKPDIRLDHQEDLERRQIIRSTYEQALASDDQNVYFIDGYSLFGDENHYDCTVDGTHPNDLGFYRMAQVIGTVVGQILTNAN